MKISEFKKHSKEDLKRILGEKKSRILNVRFNMARGAVKNVKEIKELKKDIARILTILVR